MIYLIGDCLLGNSFYAYNRKVKKINVDIDIKWAWAGTRMRYLLEPEHRGFILGGFIEWAATHNWQQEDCLLMSVGISDLRALARLARDHNYSETVLEDWTARGPNWIEIYSQFVEQYIEPIPIDSLQKGLMWIPWPWKKNSGYYALPLWNCLNKGIKSLTEDYNYRYLYLERLPPHQTQNLKQIMVGTEQFYLSSINGNGTTEEKDLKRYPRFIGGTRASGSWLLHDILAEHPVVYSFPMEIQVHKHMRDIDCDPLLKGRIIEAIFFAMGNSARAAWQLTKDSQKPKAQGQVWIDKEPEYSWKYKELLAMFPNMKIVNVIRDLRDTACSRYRRIEYKRKMDFTNPDSPLYGIKVEVDTVKDWHLGCNQVETLQIAIQRQFKTLGPSQSLIITMENLILHSEATLRQVCVFFDLPWHPPLVGYQFDRKRIGIWKTEMPKHVRPREKYKQGYYYEGK